MVADFRRPYSAFFAPRVGKKISRRFKGSASLRIHCRWSTQSALHKVGVFHFSKYEGVKFILKRSEYNIEVGDDIPPRERYVLQSAGN